MALNPSDNKRKRGRPPLNAPGRDIDASQEPTAAAAAGYDADADDAERPTKRGRPSRSTTKTTDSIVAPGDLEPLKKPRQVENRHMAHHREIPAVEKGEEVPVANMKRKRGRPALSNDMAGSEAARTAEPLSHKEKRRQRGAQDQEQEEDASQGQQRKRRGKSQRNEADEKPPEQEPEAEAEAEAEIEPSNRRKRGRPPLQDQQERAENSKQQQVEKNQPKSRKRGRPSLKDMPPSEVQNQNRNPQPTRKNSNSNSKSRANGDLEKPKKGARGMARETKETERANEDEQNDNGDAPAQEQGTKRKRRQSAQEAGPEDSNDDDDDDFPPSPLKPYTHIAPHVISVRQSTIKAKWSPLGESSLSSISSILHLAHRPILQRLSNTQQRRSHTSAALQLITNRITRKLARGLPFPPPAIPGRRISHRNNSSSSSSSRKGTMADDGRSVELDFESVLDAKQALERQLDPALHAVELLTREKERLERELERDYEVLRNLETNARSQAREYRGMLKKAHVLAPTPDGPIARRDEVNRHEDGFVHQRGTTATGGLFDNLAEEEEEGEEGVKSLALQLSSHMDSIKNNLRQTDGILPQISRSRAALQDVLFRFLDQESYDQVVLG